jgi:hypothetical protein
MKLKSYRPGFPISKTPSISTSLYLRAIFALSHPSVLPGSRRQSRTRRLCGDPRDHPQHGQGSYRPRRPNQSRAHHQPRAPRQRPHGYALAIYFDEIQDVKVTKDMLDLAKHIVNQKAADFDPEKFEDHYEEALTELINAKRNGKTIATKARPRAENVVDLMDALKKSITSEAPPSKGKRSPARPLPARRKCCCRSRGRSPRQRRRPSQSGLRGAGRRGNLLAVPNRCHGENRLGPNCP